MLIGKVIIISELLAKTGIRIGGTAAGIKIGGVDLNVIFDSKDRPYIPGSSLKGKLRSLMEYKENKSFDSRSGLHTCEDSNCCICKIWGTIGECNSLTRLLVRDTILDETRFKKDISSEHLPLKWTEVKTEININRKTGTVSKIGGMRQVERVPAGAIFSPMEMIYNIFEKEDVGLMVKIFEAMELLENDYLGGMGSRGYGKISFQNIKVYLNTRSDYETGDVNLENKEPISKYENVSQIVREYEQLKNILEDKL